MTKAPIDFVWSSLPVPALLIDPENMITETNPAAEDFFNSSGKSLCGKHIWDRLVVEAPLERSFARAKEFATSLMLFMEQLQLVTLVHIFLRMTQHGKMLQATYFFGTQFSLQMSWAIR